MNLIYLIRSNLLFTFLYNVIQCEPVQHKALVALKKRIRFSSIQIKKNMQTSISVLDLQAQLYTEPKF